jgi:predicted RNase H-like nuclease (RuvC/YqgF family)
VTPRTTRLPRLLDRVIQQRRRSETPPTEDGLGARVETMEKRIEHLENLVEGLQDSVHREALRHQREIESLNRKTEPAQIARALSRHSQEHGL